MTTRERGRTISAEPTWLLLPFHLIAEATRTVALAVRLFGNMLSGEMVAVIILGIAGLLVPIPFAMLHPKALVVVSIIAAGFGMALIESIAIYVFVIALIMLFANPLLSYLGK